MQSEFIKVKDRRNNVCRHFSTLTYAVKQINREDKSANLKYHQAVVKDYPFEIGNYHFSKIKILRPLKPKKK